MRVLYQALLVQVQYRPESVYTSPLIFLTRLPASSRASVLHDFNLRLSISLAAEQAAVLLPNQPGSPSRARPSVPMFSKSPRRSRLRTLQPPPKTEDKAQDISTPLQHPEYIKVKDML